ncbi:hypothetical protein RUND412_009581 [Rhizina undulata]
MPDPTHYSILSLPPLSTPTPTSLKKAYHAALLQHHPDKSPPTPSKSKPTFTIDQITHAYTTLSSPTLKSVYDQQLLASVSSSPNSRDSLVLQTVDLDDFTYHEDTRRWTRGCRCGEGEGFVVTEEDLERGGEVVGCWGCSLWVRVAYEVVEEW